MNSVAPRLVFQVFRDPERQWAAYEREDLAEASREAAEPGLYRLRLRLKDGQERVHLVQRGAAIFICETLANRSL